MKKRNIFDRITNLLYSNGKRVCSSYFFDNNRRWQKLKGKFKGKRIFLIANGPSLNITPLYLLKDEYTIMFNRIIIMMERLNYIPNFYMIIDEAVAPTIKSDISFFINNSELSFFPDIKKDGGLDFTSLAPYSDKVLYMYEQPVRFSRALPNIGCGCTVIYRAFQILLYMGFEEVIVVGNDMNYVVHNNVEVIKTVKTKNNIIERIRSKEDDDPNHFDPRYFGKGKEYTQPTASLINRIFNDLNTVAKEFDKSGAKVINAGYNSLVESFPKQDFYKCLGYNQDKIDQLFGDLLESKGLPSLEEFVGKSVEMSSVWDGDLDIVAIPLEYVNDIVKNKVVEYLPLGPYKDKVYMVKRELLINLK